MWDTNSDWIWPCIVVDLEDACEEAKLEYHKRRIPNKTIVRYFNTDEGEQYNYLINSSIINYRRLRTFTKERNFEMIDKLEGKIEILQGFAVAYV